MEATMVKTTKEQMEFLENKSNCKAFIGGFCSGKSFIGCYDLLSRIEPVESAYMVCSPNYHMLSNLYFSFLDVAENFFNYRYPELEKKHFSKILDLHHGAGVFFKSTEFLDDLRGYHLNGVFIDNADFVDRSAYEAIAASLAKSGGWLSLAMTENSISHWSFDILGKKQ